MRITLFTDGIWPDTIGGMQKHSFYLAKYLAQKGVQVDLYYCTAQEQDTVPSLFDSAEAATMSFTRVPFPKTGLSLPGHYVMESYRYSKALYRAMLAKPMPDMIYAQGFTGWYLLKHKQGLPPVGLNLHGVEMYQYAEGFRHKLQQQLLRIPAGQCLKRADVVFSLGGKLTEIQIKRAKAGAVTETPIGIGADWINREIKPVSAPVKFVFVGRNERRKGLSELYKAIELLHKKQVTSFECHIIGPVEGTQPGCIFHGELREESRIRQILQQSDVLLCPSLSEGMPTVILEAMASGLAVIASNVGAVANQVNAENGILVSPGNVPELAAAMETCIKASPQILNQFKQQSVMRIQSRFLWDTVADITLTAIKARL